MKGLYIHSTMFGNTGPSIHGKEFIRAMNQLGVELDIFPPVIRPYYYFQRVRDSKRLNRLKNWRQALSLIEPYIAILLDTKKWINFLRGNYDFVIVRNTDFSIHLLNNIMIPKNLPLILEINSFMGIELLAKDIKGASYSANLQQREISLIKRADAIFVVSENLKSNLLEKEIPERKITVIPNGVDPEAFHPNISGERIRHKYGLNHKIVVGFLGEVRKTHDMETLLKGFSMASSIMEGLFLLIVGPFKSFFDQIVHKEGIQSKVLVTGSIDHSVVPEYLAAFDIAVSPIKALYFSPIKNYEYMAMGKAIIATDLDSTTTMLKNAGILIKPGSVEEMYNAIVKLAQNEDLRKEMGKQARKIVMENFTWKHNARNVLKLCKETVQNIDRG
jgi:glycosyltransferase involved in cell wall biosynthesis